MKANFEFIKKLGVDWWCFHDRDIAPDGKTLEETNKNLDEVVALAKELQVHSELCDGALLSSSDASNCQRNQQEGTYQARARSTSEPLRLEIKRKLAQRSERVKSVDLHPTEPCKTLRVYIAAKFFTQTHQPQAMLKQKRIDRIPAR